MKKLSTILFTLLCTLTLSAQTLQEAPGPRPVMGSGTSGPDGTTLTCAADTVRYFGWKASGLRFLSINAATSAQGLYQYYDCPQPLTVYGFEFHGYAETVNVNAICALYLAGPDSLPIGSPLAMDTVTVDTNYGGFTLPDLSRIATFASPVLMTQPFVIVYENFTSSNTVLVCNDWDFLDGDSEWMSGGDFRNIVGGSWTRGYDMNVGGAVYNADALLNVIAEMENVSDFSVDVTCLTGPTTVNFTDYCQPVFTSRIYNQNVASGVPQNSYGWNFGDGSPVTFAINPAHAYAGTGPYTATLFATLAGWTHTCIDNHTVTLGGAGLPVAAFTPLGTGAIIDFLNTSSGATSSFWNFGDGITSTATSPTHNYTSNGTFIVMLIVSNSCGADTLLYSIDVVCDFPLAGFGYDQPSGTLLTAFTDSSSGDITSYLWDFGDGWTSTLTNPYHTYPAYGDYVVTLIISGACGNDTLIDTVHITAPVMIGNASAQDLLTVWPNPATDQVWLSGMAVGLHTIRIYDVTGRVLMQEQCDVRGTAPVILSLRSLKPGIYLLVDESGAGRSVKKLRKI